MGKVRRFFANSILKNVDMLKMPVNLNIEGKPDYQSSCGGCLSIVGFAALLVFSISQLMRYFNQELSLVTTDVSNAAG